jgi:type VI secretion system protein ImpG
MTEELLPYYNRELSYVRRMGAQFAQAHPKIAGRLRLGPDSSEDPHVERLIEAFAFLTARLRYKLDDDFPEIAEALLGVLYPHYQAPLPSLAIVQMDLDPQQSELATGYQVPRHSAVTTEPIQGEPCRFRTCYPVTVWPIDVKQASLSQPPFTAPVTPATPDAASVLRLGLSCRSKGMTFSKLAPPVLRFFLKGQAQHVFLLYELIFKHTLAVALATGPDDPAPVLLDPEEVLRPVGFGRDESLLPYTARSFPGYRLLTEYFAFRPKFLFVDLVLGPQVLARAGQQMEVYLYLSRADQDLEQNLSADTFRLGCTPIVNLYSHRAEPITLTHTEPEYRVVADARRPLAHEIYSIDRVTASARDGRQMEYRPFYSFEHGAGEEAAPVFWQGVRRPAESSAGAVDRGTEVFLSLVDLRHSPAVTTGWTLDVETTCLSRDLPARLPFGGGQPRLTLTAGGSVVSRVTCLTPPTPTLRPARRQGTLWRLVSHLSLGHLSLVEHDDKALALREVLKLYDFTDSAETRKLIDGIEHLSGRQVVGRVRGPRQGLCQGVEINLQFDPAKFAGSGLFLFATVLERFLALYCTINSFTKLVATVKGREGELHRWPPRTGEQVLI